MNNVHSHSALTYRATQLRNVAILSLPGFAPQALIVKGIAPVPAVV